MTDGLLGGIDHRHWANALVAGLLLVVLAEVAARPRGIESLLGGFVAAQLLLAHHWEPMIPEGVR